MTNDHHMQPAAKLCYIAYTDEQEHETLCNQIIGIISCNYLFCSYSFIIE